MARLSHLQPGPPAPTSGPAAGPETQSFITHICTVISQEGDTEGSSDTTLSRKRQHLLRNISFVLHARATQVKLCVKRQVRGLVQHMGSAYEPNTVTGWKGCLACRSAPDMRKPHLCSSTRAVRTPPSTCIPRRYLTPYPRNVPMDFVTMR